jgi:hypothetical protein
MPEINMYVSAKTSEHIVDQLVKNSSDSDLLLVFKTVLREILTRQHLRSDKAFGFFFRKLDLFRGV